MKLEKCPFCGEEAKLETNIRTGNKLNAFNGVSYKVICKNRLCYLRDIMDFGHDGKEFAIKAWNKRVIN